MAVVTHGRLRISADPAWGWCAGYRHPPVAEYPAGFFTAAQLDQLRADLALRVEELGEADEMRGAAPGDLGPDVVGAANGGGDTLPAATEMPGGEGSGAPAEAVAPVPAAGTVPSTGEAHAKPAEGAAAAAPASTVHQMRDGQAEADASTSATAAVGPAKGAGHEPAAVGHEPIANPAEGAAVAPSASPVPSASTARRRRNS